MGGVGALDAFGFGLLIAIREGAGGGGTCGRGGAVLRQREILAKRGERRKGDRFLGEEGRGAQRRESRYDGREGGVYGAKYQ